MRQIFLEKGMIVVRQVCEPLLDDYSVLVSVHYSFISSGTEMATITNAQEKLLANVPYKVKKVLECVASHGVEATKALIKGKLKGEVQALGYSCSGRVVAVGKKVMRFQIGDWVTCAGACLANHADLVCVPENLVAKVTGKKYIKTASLTTIGSIALQGIRRANLQLGEYVCIIGLGLLGQITVQLAKLSGCTVIGVDLLPQRLRLAREFGADYVYHATEDEVKNKIDFLTQHYGVDTAIITAASKSHVVIQQAMEVTRKKGRVVLVGDVGLNLERNPFYKKEIDFLISSSYGPGRYDPNYEHKGHDYPYAFVRWTENRNMQAFVKLIEEGRVHLNPLLSHEVCLDDAARAYAEIREKNILGFILSYQDKNGSNYYQDESSEPLNQMGRKHDTIDSKRIRFIPAVRDSLRVAVIGAGGFAKIKLLPLISKIRNVRINAIVDANSARSLNASHLYGASHALVDDQDLFRDDLADVVVISSPHKFHCDQALTALQHGKAVFMEKPMVTDLQQFARLTNFLHKNPNIPFCVDYNRAFSPFMQKIKKVISKRNSPLVIQYRINAGFIPKEHWVQTDVGAGRIIGEACHIIDLFHFLTDSQPIAVSVEALHASSDDLFPTDNFSAQIRFEDGSLCTLLYTAIGHEALGKERMELYCNGISIVMDDYRQLYGFGLPSLFNEVVSMSDKGHEQLINTFFDGIGKKEFNLPIALKRLESVAGLTLIIDKLACDGGGEKELD